MSFAFDKERLPGDQRLREVEEALASVSASACLIGEAGEIVHVNDAWERFARENDGAPLCLRANLLGKNYFDFIEGEAPRAFYAGVWLRAVRGLPVTVPGECNAPGRRRRIISEFLPVRLPGQYVVAAIHRVTHEEQHGLQPSFTAPDPASFLGADGFRHACTNCRRFRHRDGSTWTHLEGLYGDAAAPTTYGFCGTCRVLLGLPGSVPPHRGGGS